MKHLHTFTSLFESKNLSTLYHYTTLSSLEGILREDRMRSFALKYISFSRNPLLKFDDTNVRITFDGEALSNKFHIEPFMYDPSGNELFDTDPEFDGRPDPVSYSDLRKSFGEEREERITKTEIKGIKKSIIEVELIYDNEEENFEERLMNIQDENPDIDFSIVKNFTVPAQLYRKGQHTYQKA